MNTYVINDHISLSSSENEKSDKSYRENKKNTLYVE